MFTRAFGQANKEGFFNQAFPNDPGSVRTRDIQQYFGETLPNVLFSQDKNLPLESITKGYNRINPEVPFSIKNPRVKTGVSNDYNTKREAECKATGNGDQFDHLVSLAASQDGRSKTRCGWMYNTQNPASGRGAYGTTKGPIVDTQTKGTWMWNLEEAKQKYHKSICDKVAGCADIDSSMYQGRCGWNTKAGKAIPIRNGEVAYPYSPNLNCSANNLVTKGNSCPRPAAKIVLNEEGKPVQVQSPAAGACTPLPNGNLTRDCLVQRAISAGCSDDGTLAYALKAGSDTNYLDNLSQNKAFKTYQERAVLGLDVTTLKNGKITAAKALDEFKRINDHALSTQDGALEFASRDLCFKRGTMDDFDFCSELTPLTPGPFELDCLQKAFLKAGGQKTGTMFPKNPSFWNNNAKVWGDVLKIIQSIVDRLASTKRAEQEAATKEFYGITLQARTDPSSPYDKIKFIRIDSGNQALQLAQVVGYDMKGVNVTIGRKVTASPALNWGQLAGPELAVDGNEQLKPFPDIYHSQDANYPFFEIELDTPMRLSYIRVYNRQDCCQERLGVFRISALDVNRKAVWTDLLKADPIQTLRVEESPANAPLSRFQDMYSATGCTRVFTEADVGPGSWWRKQNWDTVQADMNAYKRLTDNCSGDNRQHEWCSPGKCPPK